MKSKKYEMEIGGEKLTAEFTDLAENAHGSVLLSLGETTVLATAVISKGEKDIEYFPLSVEYEERFYASGQILGSRFVRREGRPSDEAILSGRIIDRTIRPLFDNDLRNEIQVIVTVLSLGNYDPDVLGVIATSLALATSSIPWDGPVGAVRVGKLKNKEEFLVNPSYEIRDNADYELDLIACGRDEEINMIEVGSNETSEEVLIQALEKAKEELNKIQKFQEKIIEEIGHQKIEIKKTAIPADLQKAFEIEVLTKIKDLIGEPGKEKIYFLEDEWFAYLKENMPEADQRIAKKLFHQAIDDFIHKLAIEDGKRIDNRDFDELRNLYAKAGGISPVLHGTGIFYRGGTHIFSAITLGSPSDSQIMGGMETQADKRFMHHYNFPPFSVGEIGRVGGTNRRMIGHGALAEKALMPILPSKEEFPYTIRIVSEVLASNGSSSMGSVCGSTLALMDAGVPIKKPVAGIASGLMMIGDKYKLLTDIQGPEDEHGDMDFKVAGTRDGVTAVQMDVKVSGISLPILKEAFEKAKMARLQILDVIEAEIKTPRKELSVRVPRIISIKIRPDQIGMVIGGGGKVINEIKDKTGVEIDIEEDGIIYITGEMAGVEKAKILIEEIVKEYKTGDKLMGEVVRVADFGVIVKLDSRNDGLVHVSEIASFRIERVEDYMKVGMKVPVIVKGIDDKGRMKLSIKDVDPNFIQKK
ncbi:MAG: Polyribonucleotide nucleotidyltransferase [Parcubacteria group bacterium GW2011_GWB1_35_5]|uniref:Polyribonucleotide nucleotidyltransferase n=1 Tax=Candidatus Zambryskibacteria bacterium RIFCSPLOWO2_01_FULL_35_19 TaxID=1802757 RepID=A0A1G2U0J9_9BACT|nr:MAG: Polyribonucleotide nucleotidyltransferase [Parcubacteria group bacterium GW2011_GWC1_34_10]KKP80429.1 MAG: Polyribonucleotide nucleotidyltransferase [Parcubacteria group bacterium GW2011_GWB1_35_5]OHA86707.1 MAG: polyribonucleotide nucleotidyltransferase [Candidatus Zambryskibacteria bacterium RIFCSPHIGHO2_01_FULL_35_32]OHB02352.1 MAG: polyribonucleotide nucleotidyltransferase [Candidatus Zambryskibacteria bacterium RIFCSPLOWO2_01_FULL_35_19]